MLVVIIVMVGAASAEAEAQSDTVPVVAVNIDPRPADERTEPLLVDDLGDQAVLQLEIRDFPANVTGMLRQCLEGEQRRCANQQELRFDDRGRADVQYLISSTVAGAAGTCGGSVRCTVEVSAGRVSAVLETFFGLVVPPPGHLEVTPRTGIEPGQSVSVAVSGFPPGEQLVVTVCAAPAVRGDRCGAPGPEEVIVVDGEGSAATSMVLDVTTVGADGVACGRRTSCQMVVVSDDIAIRANTIRLGLAQAPGAEYDLARLVTGLLVAVVLVAAAAALVVTGDWGPPGEADGSAIDDAVFADLDAEAAAFDDASRVVAAQDVGP
ncbi:MAG: neocarzinostatin apoprotein domain-containing protein [Acidimicrobiales bacterium]